jgi:hypothetical protein
MTMNDSERPALRPVKDQSLHIWADEDISRLVGELYVTLREVDGVDDATAEQAAEMTYDLLTGDWTDD